MAGGLSLSLGLVLWAFAAIQPGTLLIRYWAVAILVLAVAFVLSGIGPLLPRWGTVMGTNMLLLSAGVIFHTGVLAWVGGRPPGLDRFGWAVVVGSALPFGYWGLVEPDGHLRSMVFSFAILAVNSRTAWTLAFRTRGQVEALPLRFLTLLFTVLTAWMLARGLWLLVEPAPAPAQRGANPTQWVSVFGYIVFIALIVGALLWVEVATLRARSLTALQGVGRQLGGSTRLVLLWGTVALSVVTTGGGILGFYHSVQAEEADRAARETQIANDAFVEHTQQVVGQADTLLRAVRGQLLITQSLAQTERFIASLGLEGTLYEGVYLIDAEGRVVVPPAARGEVIADQDGVRFHASRADDVIHISPTDWGPVAQQPSFRLSRRIEGPQGGFGGVVLITVKSAALSDYYGRLNPWPSHVAALLDIQDHKLRARYPEVEDDALYTVPRDSSLWRALEQAPQGRFREVSPVDQTEREWVYRQVGQWPLVTVSGYTDADVDARVLERLRLVGLAAISANGLILLLALVLTLSLQQREALGHYLQALREVHDRNTALFEATQEGVILLDGDRPVECNPGTLRIFGAHTKAEFLALPPWSPRLTPPVQPCGTDTPTFAARQITLAREKGAHRFEYLHKRLDTGKEFPTDIMLTAVKLTGKTVLQAVVRDISDRVRYERELQRANDELSRRNQEQDRFLSMLSHELKTPLSVIKMSLGASANLAANRERMLRNVTAIDAIVERCLQTDRLQHGRIVAHRRTCDIAQLLSRLIAESREPRRIPWVAASDLPPADTDPLLLEVILGNLLDNALKYSDPATLIRVAVASAVEGERAGVRIDVTNTPGVAGMPDATRVFSKYYRAPGAHGKTGSGLGLHIAEGFARLLGGRLGYQPEGNQVKFSLWLPH